jgi:hypothetical protein
MVLASAANAFFGGGASGAAKESTAVTNPTPLDARGRAQIGGLEVSGRTLRDLELTRAVDGKTVRIGSEMGRGKSVVVFLRHLG